MPEQINFTPLHEPPNGWSYPLPGMSLRAWLAGMALQGELASQSSMAGTWKTQDATKCVARCITFADALIAELQKPKP